MTAHHTHLKMRGKMLTVLTVLCLAALSLSLSVPGTVYGGNGGQHDTIEDGDTTGGSSSISEPTPAEPEETSFSKSLQMGLDLLQVVSYTW